MIEHFFRLFSLFLLLLKMLVISTKEAIMSPRRTPRSVFIIRPATSPFIFQGTTFWITLEKTTDRRIMYA